MKKFKLPRDFRRRMDAFWVEYEAQDKASAEDRPAFYAALTARPQTGLQYCGSDERFLAFAERLDGRLEPLPWGENLYLFEPDGGRNGRTPGRDIFHDLGLIYVQEPSAAMPLAHTDLSQAKRILDFCAAPGGKTNQLLRAKAPDAVLWANEVHPKRARILQQNMTRLGAADVLISRTAAAEFAGGGAFFDFILLDVPCSGEALLRRKPSTAYQWRRYPPKVTARVQREILGAVWERLLPGGRLLYASCTFNSIENEELIASFVRDRTDAEIIPFDRPRAQGVRPGLAVEGCRATESALRIFPQDGVGEGQFGVLLRKTGDDAEPPPVQRGADSLTRAPQGYRFHEPPCGASFPAPYRIVAREGRLYAVREQELFCMRAHPETEFLKTGIYLGDDKEGDFQPGLTWASLQDPQRYAKCLDLTERLEKLTQADSGTNPTWPEGTEGLYLLTAYERGIGWLFSTQAQETAVTWTPAVRRLKEIAE